MLICVQLLQLMIAYRNSGKAVIIPNRLIDILCFFVNPHRHESLHTLMLHKCHSRCRTISPVIRSYRLFKQCLLQREQHILMPHALYCSISGSILTCRHKKYDRQSNQKHSNLLYHKPYLPICIPAPTVAAHIFFLSLQAVSNTLTLFF